jgi:hypothetical protein
LALRELRGERRWWALVVGVVDDHIVLGVRSMAGVKRTGVELCAEGLKSGFLVV